MIYTSFAVRVTHVGGSCAVIDCIFNNNYCAYENVKMRVWVLHAQSKNNECWHFKPIMPQWAEPRRHTVV